ncbi:MAG: hypothetical protein AAFR18_22575 [Cyanobacteria bacterium J06627_32]
MKSHRRAFNANPPRYKTFLLTWLAIYPLINLILLVLGPLLNLLPLYLRTLCLTGLLVFLMTYIVMPWMTRHFHHWLHTRNHRFFTSKRNY